MNEAGPLQKHQRACSIDDIKSEFMCSVDGFFGVRSWANPLMQPHAPDPAFCALPHNTGYGIGRHNDDRSVNVGKIGNRAIALDPLDFVGVGVDGNHLITVLAKLAEYQICKIRRAA